MALVTQLMPPTRGDISQIRFGRYSGESKRSPTAIAVLTRESRTRVREELERLTSQESFGELVGVIRKVNLDKQTFTLRVESETDVICEYGSELEEAVKESLDQVVLVVGTTTESSKTGSKRMSVETIEGGDFQQDLGSS